MRKKYSIEEISQRQPRELIGDLAAARFSLLRSFGCGALNFANFWVRLACHFFISIAKRRALRMRKKDPSIDETDAHKYSLCRIFHRGAPSVILGDTDFPNAEYGLVIGFNHPSLGEIIRLMYLCMAYYPERNYLFPVNLIWYEALVPVIGELKQYGFTLMPIITASAKRRLMKHARTTEARAQINILTRSFDGAYADRCVDFVKNGQIVLVAPSTTRKSYLYESADVAEGKKPISPPTMTMLALKLIKANIEKFAFVPVAVLLPEDASRGLNLLSEYKFVICCGIEAETVRRECEAREPGCNARCFERYFMDRIARQFALHYAGDRIVKPD